MGTTSKSKSPANGTATAASATAADVLSAPVQDTEMAAPAVVPPGASPGTAVTTGDRSRKPNPFQPLLAVMGGDPATEADFAEMAKMIESKQSGTPYYVADSLLLTTGMFLVRRFYANLSGLVDRICSQLSKEKGLPLDSAREQMTAFLGIEPAAPWNSQDGSDNTTYRRFTLGEISRASSLIWEHYGEEGITIPGLIQRSSQKRQQPPA